MFRSLILFRLSPTAAAAVPDLETTLAEHTLRPIGALELSTSGFVSVFNDESKTLVHTVGPYTLVHVGNQSRMLPASVVNNEVRKRCDKIRAEEDRKVGGKEKKRMKDEVITDLLPRAFISEGRLPFYFDKKQGWLVFDASSRKSAENALSTLREALGTLPAVPINPEESPRAMMTQWLQTGELPEGLVLGEEVEMKDPGETGGAVVRAKNQELQCDEIRDHLKAGKQVTQLALVWDNRISFMLTEDLSIKKFKYLDVVLDEAGGSNGDTAEGALDADFTLLTLEADKLIQKMVEWFKIEPAAE